MSVTIRKFAPDDALSASVLNVPIVQLENALQAIKGQVDSITAQGCIKLSGLPCSASVVTGDVVYLDEYGSVEQAQALWSQTHGPQGEAVPAAQARAIGVAVEVSGGVCTVVASGIVDVDAAAVATRLFGTTTPIAGVYYLSEGIAGGVVAQDEARPLLALPIVTVDGQHRVMVNQVHPMPGHHIHKRYDVSTASADWEMDGAQWKYTGDALDELLYFNVGDCVVVYDGVLDASFSLGIEDGAVYLRAGEAPDEAKVLSVFSSFPYPFDQPVLRAVETVGPRLRSASSGGVVTLSLDNSTPGQTANSATAVSSLNEDGSHSLTPVVSQITVDDTMTLTPAGNGIYGLSGGYGNGQLLYPSLVSLAGTTVSKIYGQMAYVFPGIDRPVSITCSIPINTPPAGIQWRLHPFVKVASPGTGDYTASFTATIVFSPSPSMTVSGGSAVTVDFPSAPSSPGSPNLVVAVETGKVSMARTVLGESAATSGVATVELTATTSTAYTVIGFGVVVIPESL